MPSMPSMPSMQSRDFRTSVEIGHTYNNVGPYVNRAICVSLRQLTSPPIHPPPTPLHIITNPHTPPHTHIHPHITHMHPHTHIHTDDFVAYLKCLSQIHCRTSTVAAIRVASTILEVLQGPCTGNQVRVCVCMYMCIYIYVCVAAIRVASCRMRGRSGIRH